MRYYDYFAIPFIIGVAVLFSVILYRYFLWYRLLGRRDKKLVREGILSVRTLSAGWEVVRESLLHVKIFKRNPVLGYMHMSLAFGWFLLIVVGWIEVSVLLPGQMVPLHAHVFFKYFAPVAHDGKLAHALAQIMDILLLFVLSGVLLAWLKRSRSRMMGLKRTTKHTTGDRIALTALWFVFPARLVAEGAAAGLSGSDTFLTGSLGDVMHGFFGYEKLWWVSTFSWWFYSCILTVFLISLPFSRYMHIFTEVPLIFLRKYRLRSEPFEKSYDQFQIQACSRCGICLDPCQLMADAGISSIQPVYYLRDRRYGRLDRDTADNCLMCGRCENACPVGLELNMLRLNGRTGYAELPDDNRYRYLPESAQKKAGRRVGYFAGCMSHLTPAIPASMMKIFKAAGDTPWWADENAGVCCGRPLKLSGEVSAARKMMDFNEKMFLESAISVLVTSCPICLKVFREDYRLTGIRILHHSEYIDELIGDGILKVRRSEEVYTYHDPCELGRGCGIYDEPRQVLYSVGDITEPANSRQDSLCCGSSLANHVIDDKVQSSLASSVVTGLEATGVGTIVTSCPLCKKALGRVASVPVRDLAEIVAGNIC